MAPGFVLVVETLRFIIPILIIGGIFYYIYSKHYKNRWEKFAKKLFLEHDERKNIPYPQPIRDVGLFNSYDVRLYQYLTGKRNNVSIGVYSYMKILDDRSESDLLITANSSKFSFPDSLITKDTSIVGRLIKNVMPEQNIGVIEGTPRGYSFYCPNSELNQDFVNKVKQYLTNINKNFKFRRIILKQQSAVFIFDIEQTRNTPKLVIEAEMLLNYLTKTNNL